MSILAAACAAAGANIVDAKIHTTRDGRALNSIYINREHDALDDEMRRAERVCELIRQALTGEIRLEDLLNRRRDYSRQRRAFSIAPEVTVKNDLSDDFTVIEIKCLDRPGILAVIAFAISELNLNIVSAQIATFGEKVIDTFYVTDLVGDKIMLESRQNKIIQSLTEAIKSGSAKDSQTKRTKLATANTPA